MRFTILSILLVTAAIAMIISIDRQGTVIGPVFFFSVAAGLTLLSVGIYARTQLAIASAIGPTMYSRKLLWIATAICGRTYTAWALHNFGVRRFEAGEVENAVNVFEQVVRLCRFAKEYWLWLAAANYQLGRYEIVDENVTRAIELGSTSSTAYAYRGFSRYAISDFAGALVDFQKVDGTIKENSRLVWYRAYVYEMYGLWAEAAKDYLLAFELDGSNVAAGIGLARLQAGCPDETIRDGDKAVENATNMCVRTNWENWAAISVLAAAFAAKEDFSSAVKYAEKAQQLAPESIQPERAQRIEQYRKGTPFRLVALHDLPRLGDFPAR